MKNLVSALFFVCALSLPLASAWAGDVQVNLNTADAQLLADALHGVGLKKAEAIVAWRETNGDFKTINELLQVKGIGETLLAKNKEMMVVK